MKVLFITNVPSPYRVEFFNELSKSVELTVVFERHSSVERDDKWVSKDSMKFKCHFLKGRLISPDLSFSVGVLRYLKRSYDHIILGMYSSPTEQLAIAYLKMKRIPFILSTDGGFPGQEGFLKNAYKRFLIRSASWWLSSGNNADVYLSHYGADSKKIYHYPFSSVKSSSILKTVPSCREKRMLRKNLLGLSEKKMILCVSRIIPQKGIDTLIEAFRRIHTINQDIQLVIVGGEATHLREISVKQVPKDVTTVPFLESAKLSNYYKAADCFALLTRNDVWGLVLNEAIAAGLPILSTTMCGAAVDLINPQRNGYIVDGEDINQVCSGLNNLLQLAEDDRTADISISIAKRYTIENMATVHLQVLDQIQREKKYENTSNEL